MPPRSGVAGSRGSALLAGETFILISIVAAPIAIPNSNAYGSSFLTLLPAVCFLDGILPNEWGWDGLSM